MMANKLDTTKNHGQAENEMCDTTCESKVSEATADNEQSAQCGNSEATADTEQSAECDGSEATAESEQPAQCGVRCQELSLDARLLDEHTGCHGTASPPAEDKPIRDMKAALQEFEAYQENATNEACFEIHQAAGRMQDLVKQRREQLIQQIRECEKAALDELAAAREETQRQKEALQGIQLHLQALQLAGNATDLIASVPILQESLEQLQATPLRDVSWEASFQTESRSISEIDHLFRTGCTRDSAPTAPGTNGDSDAAAAAATVCNSTAPPSTLTCTPATSGNVTASALSATDDTTSTVVSSTDDAITVVPATNDTTSTAVSSTDDATIVVPATVATTSAAINGAVVATADLDASQENEVAMNFN